MRYKHVNQGMGYIGIYDEKIKDVILVKPGDEIILDWIYKMNGS